jgi:hypothetical protein
MKGSRLMKLTAMAAIALLPIRAAGASRHDTKAIQEEGEYRILLAGREIGSEHYSLVTSGDSVQSTSVLNFRNPQDTRQKISIETRLGMDSRFTPTSYLLKSDVEGKKGTVVGRFSPNQVIFEYDESGTSAKRGLLVGDRYTILDTNIFHHFIFLARLYLEKGRSNVERYEVVIPQENESGYIKIGEVGRETLDLRGKKTKCRRLRMDTGSLQIELWVDDRGLVQKISVPARQIEVLRND